MKIVKLLLLTVILIGLSSCEGFRYAKGVVYESDTNIPIDSVLCKIVVGGTDQDYTDSVGQYYVRGRMGACWSSCEDIEVEYSKKGYITQKVKNPKKDIYLEKK